MTVLKSPGIPDPLSGALLRVSSFCLQAFVLFFFFIIFPDLSRGSKDRGHRDCAGGKGL